MAILFPRPFAIVVDDLGWNEGSDLTQTTEGGPYRCGFERTFTLEDYNVIADVGKAVGARIQCAFILSEMDRENILARYPTTTYMRDAWDNTSRVHESQITIMNFVRDQSAHLEFGFHGVGHEYWAKGEVQKRAEWYNLQDKEPWPEASLREHIRCFREIMAQYGFTKDHGHSFPESFVPCAYSYYWNPNGDYSLGKLLRDAGVKYANTDFAMIPELNPPSDLNGGGFDHGVHVINRINCGNQWDAVATLPGVPIENQASDVIESHWPNWLSEDRANQHSVTNQWIAYYRSVQKLENRYIAKNTEQLHSQWLYNRYARVTEPKAGHVVIDNTSMPGEVYENSLLGNIVLKARLNNGEHISSAYLDDTPIGTAFENEGYGFLYLPPLEKREYRLQYTLGESLPDKHVLVDGTFNVYRFETNDSSIKLLIKVYGTQTVKIKCGAVLEAISLQKDVVVHNLNYDSARGHAELQISGKDMQGSIGEIVIKTK